MDHKSTTGIEAANYFSNERQLASHSPYPDGSGDPPGYGIQMQHPGDKLPATVVMIEEPLWNWCTLITTVIACLLCPLCGFIGTVMGLLSYTDHKAKNYNNANSKKSVALCCGITGIVVFVICFIIMISLFASWGFFAQRIYEDAVYKSNNNRWSN